MKFLRFYILYRLPIIIGLIVMGVVFHLYIDVITAWLCYIVAFISLLLYFMIGTMRIVQEAVAEGNVEAAGRYLKQIKFPRLLLKPVRASYYMLQSNLSLAANDLKGAEDQIRKSLNTKSTLNPETKGMNLLQLGFIQIQKGNLKEARLNLTEAVKIGISDKESLAAAYLQLCSIEIHRKQYKIAKAHFKKAKAQKPKGAEIVKQIAEIEKHISRMPG